MPDMEKVITEMEDALSGNLAKAGHVYRMSLNGLKDKALKDALDLIHDLQSQIAMLVVAQHELCELLKEQEAVVLCKDCKWYDERISLCDNCGLPREQTFFCADMERRTDDA